MVLGLGKSPDVHTLAKCISFSGVRDYEKSNDRDLLEDSRG